MKNDPAWMCCTYLISMTYASSPLKTAAEEKTEGEKKHPVCFSFAVGLTGRHTGNII